MKPRKWVQLSALSTALVALTAVALLVSAVNTAAAETTATYPAITIDTTVCKAEHTAIELAEVLYDDARQTLQRDIKAGDPPEKVRKDQVAVFQAAIGVIDARYAEAKCQSDAAGGADKNCNSLALEYNRLNDQVALYDDSFEVANRDYTMAKKLQAKRAISDADFQKYATAYKVAQLKLKIAQQKADAAKAAAVKAGCKNIDRPKPKPTSTSTPTGTSTTTTSTTDMCSVTDTLTATDTTTTSVVPTDMNNPCFPIFPQWCTTTDTPTATATAADTATTSVVPTDTCLPVFADPCTPTDTPTFTDTPTVTAETPTDIVTSLYVCDLLLSTTDTVPPTDTVTQTDTISLTPSDTPTQQTPTLTAAAG